MFPTHLTRDRVQEEWEIIWLWGKFSAVGLSLELKTHLIRQWQWKAYVLLYDGPSLILAAPHRMGSTLQMFSHRCFPDVPAG